MAQNNNRIHGYNCPEEVVQKIEADSALYNRSKSEQTVHAVETYYALPAFARAYTLKESLVQRKTEGEVLSELVLAGLASKGVEIPVAKKKLNQEQLKSLFSQFVEYMQSDIDFNDIKNITKAFMFA